MMKDGKVTILLPNFRTPVLTKLCLRSLNKYTDMSRVVIRAIDNGSGENEESLQYLRSLPWIHLTVNPPAPEGTNPAEIHARSMDQLLEQIDTEFVLSFHTDTIVLDDQWLDYLLNAIRKSDRIAGVGSWKLAQYSPLKRFGKTLEDWFRLHILCPLTGRKCAVTGHDGTIRYLRSHCALYRTELIKNNTNGFFDGESACKSLYKKLTAQGFEMVFLPETELGRHIAHFDHATMVLNPQIGGRRTTKPKARRKLLGEMGDARWEAVLSDDSLDNERKRP